jgi:hypothetical protein
MIARADKRQSSIKVSFVGDTGAGKSLIITQLLKFDDRIRYGRCDSFIHSASLHSLHNRFPLLFFYVYLKFECFFTVLKFHFLVVVVVVVVVE